jgi:GDP-L-fucose synthase
MPHSDHYGYAYSKRMLDIMSRTYCEQYGVKYNSVVFGNIYGPGDHFGDINGHLVPSLIYKAYDAYINEKDSFEVWGDGAPKRQFIYVKDVVEVCKRLLFDWEEPGIINVVNPKEYSIFQLASIISSYLGGIKFHFNTDMPNGQFRKPMNINKFLSYFPQFVFTELEEGIKETVDLYINNY